MPTPAFYRAEADRLREQVRTAPAKNAGSLMRLAADYDQLAENMEAAEKPKSA
jgi:hypothetical protein